MPVLALALNLNHNLAQDWQSKSKKEQVWANKVSVHLQ